MQACTSVDLYALPPEEFTAARDALAKQDKTVKALRRPTVAAWVVNTLVRQDAPLLEQLLAVGEELAQAQSSRDAAALRTLGDQRRQLVAAVTVRAVQVAGREVTAAVRDEVAATLEAALADPASAEAVRSGRLVRSLSFAGFGGVDLEGAVADVRPPVAAPSGPTRQKVTSAQASAAQDAAGGERARSARVVALETAALEAQGVLDDTVRRDDLVTREQRALQTDLGAVEERLRTAEARRRDLRAALAVAEQDHEQVRAAYKKLVKADADLTRRSERSQVAVAAAQQRAAETRAALDAARRT